MKYTASRLSEGNKVFPAEITTELNGLTVKIPGLFNGQTRHLDYQNIGEVSVNAPLVGYSTITFYTAGTRVSVHGFTSDEVKQIKKAIDKGKQNILSRSGGHQSFDKDESPEYLLAEAEAERLDYELEKKRKHDNAEKPWLNDYNFRDKKSINAISFPDNTLDIEKTIEKIIKAGIETAKEVITEDKVTAVQYSMADKSFLKPYYEEIEMLEVCIEKSKEGIRKLRRKVKSDHSELQIIIDDLNERIDELSDKWIPILLQEQTQKRQKNILFIVFLIIANVLFWGSLYYFSSTKQ